MSDDASLEAAVAQVMSAVPNADEDEIRAEFEKYQSEFLIPPSDAMRSVMRRFQTENAPATTSTNQGAFRSGTAPMKKVNRLTELGAEDKNVEVVAEIISHNTRMQTVRGQEREIAFGLLEDNPDGEGDGARTRWSYKDWGGNKNIIPGVVVRIEGGSVNEYNSELSLNINQSSRVVVLKESSTPRVNADEPVSLQKAGQVEGTVTVIGRVMSVRNDVITRKDGSGTMDIVKGRLADDSGSLSFVSWEPFTHEPGTLVKVERAQVRRFRDNPEMNIGRYTKVEVFHDAGFAEMDSLKDSTRVDISSLRDGAREIDIIVEMVDWTERVAKVNGEDRTLWSGELVDPTGRCRMTSWNELPIDASALPLCLSLSRVRVRTWQGIPDITVDDASQVEILAETPWESIDPSDHIVEVSFSELVSGTSRVGVKTEATVVAVREDSGVIIRCSECRRLMRDGSCIEHGNIEGSNDFRIRMVIDDGVSTASLSLDSGASENLIGERFKELENDQSEDGKSSFVADLRNSFLGRRLSVEGRSFIDEQGIMFVANKVEVVEIDAALAATEVRARWGVV